VRSAVVAAVIALTATCSAPAPVADPSLAPIVLGQRAIRPVPAFGSVWIASAAEGTVQRVDAKTGAMVAKITVADPQRLLAAGCAPSSEHAYATGSFGLRACDAPSAVAAGAGAIWAVANDANAIVRVDPARNTVTDSIALGFNAWAVTATDGAVWVSDYAVDALVRVDPATRRVVARIPVPSGPTEIATSGDAVWVVCSAAGTVARIDPNRNAVVATVTVSPWALAIAIAGDDVWVRGGSARADGGLFRIDARTNAVTLVVQAGAPQGREGVASIAATDRGVWVPGVSLDYVDRATGAIAARLPISSYAVALDGGTLWVLDVFGRLERRAAPR
jgi:DNA-binding beta-propeller fold protein YncE